MKITLFLCLSFLFIPQVMAENWPGWRGPRGDGTSFNQLPTEWSAEKHVAWKVPLPGKGHSSPIIWEDRIFLVTAEGQDRNLVCLDRRNGRTIWKTTVLVAPLEGIHKLNSFASSTPCTDGERIYVSFLDQKHMFIAAYDFDGKKLWEKRPGIFSSKHGYCSSPILWKDKLIINGDHDGEAYLVALGKAKGETLWKTPRPNKTRSYCTPIIREIDGRTQMILSGSLCVNSYDPDTGEEHWIIDGPTQQYVASLVYNGKLLFMTCGFPERHMLAIDPKGKGNVTETHIKWRTKKASSYVPSPISVGPYFLVVDDKGIASCFDAETGERYWMERMGMRHSASLIEAKGLVYFPGDRGKTWVVKPGKTFDVVAVNDLGEKLNASPAVYGGQLFLRGDKHLFCIGE